MTRDDTQVLTFSLGEADYCLDIDYVAEIVDGGKMTSIPNTEAYVEGIMDLRGQTTSIVNPSRLLDTENIQANEVATDGGRVENRIIVLDSDTAETDNTTGLLVSDVKKVTEVSDDSFEIEKIGDSPLLQGVIKQDEEFTLWLDPDELTA
jgi:purine-binding chemotaxis protein CheW